MDLKIKRDNKGRFTSAKGDKRIGKINCIFPESFLREKVDEAIEAFNEEHPPEETKVELDVTHHQGNQDITEWFSNNSLKLALTILAIALTIYVAVRI